MQVAEIYWSAKNPLGIPPKKKKKVNLEIVLEEMLVTADCTDYESFLRLGL